MKNNEIKLNIEQMRAVKHNAGPCLVVAGPGSGKTTVITARVLYMIKNLKIQPSKILVVTFSRAAANEMKERFKDYSKNNYRDVTFGTFHSVFFRILQEYKGYKLENLIDEQEKITILRNIIRNNNLGIAGETEEIIEIINEISYLKNTFIDINYYNSYSCKNDSFRQIYKKVDEVKESSMKFDYDDMLRDCFYLLKNDSKILEQIRRQYEYINVDEFQDINPVQFECIKLIASPNNNLFVVGDDDQSIYSFRGAAPDIMLDFEKHYKNGVRIILDTNYRSMGLIVDAANLVISYNKNRFSKVINTVNDKGENPNIFYVDDLEKESEIIVEKVLELSKNDVELSEIAIIYRTNLQARAIVDTFVCNNIPFHALDGLSTLYNHWVYNDILSYLSLSQEYDNNSFFRIANKPKRYISRDIIGKYIKNEICVIDNLILEETLNYNQKNLLMELKNNLKRMKNMTAKEAIKYIRKYIGYDDYLKEYALNKGVDAIGLIETAEDIETSSKSYNTIPEFLAHINNLKTNIYKSGKNKNVDGVRLLTMHKAKGLEFEIVFLIGCIDGLVPYIKDGNGSDEIIEEERRLFYVAMTRAKKSLFIISPKNRYNKKAQASRFIKEITDGKQLSEEQMKIGQRIYHKIYGEGTIQEIFSDKSKRMRVSFNTAEKELDIETCLKNNIIKLINN